MLTLEQKRSKLNWFLFITGYYAFAYLWLNNFNLERSYYVNVAFAFEESIPFFPIAVLGYTLVYVAMLALYFLIDEIKLFHRAVVTTLVVSTAHFLLFFFLPVKMLLRPDLSMLHEGFANQLALFYFTIDQPTNCFPSLHVALPTMVTFLLWHKRWWRQVFLSTTIITALSVIFVKQHYIADVVAGAGLTFLLCKLVEITEKHWSKLLFARDLNLDLHDPLVD